jgi:uncharacterized membrane protein YagU involved in acid resistance
MTPTEGQAMPNKAERFFDSVPPPRQQERRQAQNRPRNFWHAAVAGALGGVAGAWAMKVVELQLSRAASQHGAHADTRPTRLHDRPERAAGPATKLVTVALQELTAVRDQLDGETRGGRLVHYSFAAAAGAAYSLLAEYSGVTAVAAGMSYGATLWFTADFILIPRSGLSKRAPLYGWGVETLALAGHLAFGAVLETARRRIRTAL